MRLKTYFVDTVEEAMLRARSELGDEAMLVHSKRTGSEAEHLGIRLANPSLAPARPLRLP